MLGFWGTIDAIKNASGVAQHILYGIWGFIIAGMYIDIGSPILIVGTWAVFSILTILAVFVLSKNLLKKILLIDVLLTAIVLGLYVSNTEFMIHSEAIANIYYTTSIDGKMIIANRSTPMLVNSWQTTLNFISHVLPCLVLILHGIYLANLIQRQELQRKRFSNE